MVTRNPYFRWCLRLVCALYLFLFVFSEGYSAAATALDDSRRFPHWESTVGLFLFILPCELLASLALLLRSGRKALGFYLVIVNMTAYLAFMCLDVIVGQGSNWADWEFASVWAIAMAVAVGAAGFLRSSFRPS